MRRLVGLLASVALLLAGLFTIPSTAAGLATESACQTGSVYEVRSHAAVISADAPERGPPLQRSSADAEGAVDRWSRGTLACADEIASDISTYDEPAKQNAWATGTATVQSRVVRSDLSSVKRGGVAANGGDDLLRLSTKDSWGRLDTLDDHFMRHGGDFGAASADDYARMASEFYQTGLKSGLPTKLDPKTGVVRIYDYATNTFGSFNPAGTTKTFYKPDPASHGFATNWDYWVSQPGYAP